jgi:hypothetical protein
LKESTKESHHLLYGEAGLDEKRSFRIRLVAEPKAATQFQPQQTLVPQK